MSESPYWMAGQSKKMAMEWLLIEQLEEILKWYWKSEKVWEVTRENCRLSCRDFMGLLFFDGTVTGPMHLNILWTFNSLAIVSSMGMSHLTFNKMAHHQDNRSYLDETQLDHWIGRRGSVEYPPHSPSTFTCKSPRRMEYIVKNYQHRWH